jgi:tRNA modification GTPase
VSPVPGTTRDTLEETVDLDGIPVTIIDTAGVRRADDAIEAEGVRRARVAAGEADLIIFVLDAGRSLGADERDALEARDASDGGSIVVANKIDLAPSTGELPWPGAIPFSALTGEGLDALRGAIHQALRGVGSVEDPVLTNVRHAAALEGAVAALDRARASLPLSEEIVLEDLRAALSALGEITGEVANDELYDRIFSTFCIGK